MQQFPDPGTPEWDVLMVDIKQSLENSREAILLRMEFHDYECYFAGSLWKKIRRRILSRDQQKCVRCRRKATEVHHESYEEAVLKGENDDQLVSLCRSCHELIEFDDLGCARNESEKRRVLRDPNLERDRSLISHRSDCPRPKVDIRNIGPKYPSEWPSMNELQREGWLNEYRWIFYTRKCPDWKTRTNDVDEYGNSRSKLRSAYDKTKRNRRPDKKIQ